MDHESLKKVEYQNVKTQSLSATKPEALNFLREASPALGTFIVKGIETTRDSGKNPEFGNRLIKEVYPKIKNAGSIREIEPLLTELYTVYPRSKELIGEIDSTFGNGGGGVMAIPPVLVAGAVIFCIGVAVGAAVGYATS